jgi:hypothetical protein
MGTDENIYLSRKGMDDNIITFTSLLDECLRAIYGQVSSKRGLRASHVV